jgi:integral membrane protein (TIGR01906 family)
MHNEERVRLATVGLHAVLSGIEGMHKFEKAVLDTGKQAFNQREISHMKDVKHLFSLFFFSVLFLFFIVLGFCFYSPIMALRAIKYGAVLTFCLVGVIGLAAALNFDTFFSLFHELLFKRGFYLFNEIDDTDFFVWFPWLFN